MKDSLDSRYASALFSLAKDEKKVSLYQSKMKELYLLFNDEKELVHLLTSAFIALDERYKVVDRLLKSYPPALMNFVKVLMKNHRLNHYQSIFKAFNSLCNEEKHVLEGIIYSTDKLDVKIIKEIESALKNKERVAVELTNRIDPSLIGGVKVVINNRVYDYSIASELSAMRSALKV